MDLTPHPDTNDTGSPPPRNAPGRTTAATVALATLAVIVVVVIVLHLTGVVGPLSK